MHFIAMTLDNSKPHYVEQILISLGDRDIKDQL